MLSNRLNGKSELMLLVSLLVFTVGCSQEEVLDKQGPTSEKSIRQHVMVQYQTINPRDFSEFSDDSQYDRIRKNFHKVKKGMTKAEVAQVIGYPKFNRESDRWIWKFRDTGMADLETYVIEFSRGIVTESYSAGIHYAPPEL
jgi:hypothetical protein